MGRGNRRSTKTNVACLVSPNHGSRFRTILAFEALLSQIRSGRLERERPLDVYGAAVQQLLSVISERNGAYLRIMDLAEHFALAVLTKQVVVDEDLAHFAAAFAAVRSSRRRWISRSTSFTSFMSSRRASSFSFSRI